MMEKRGDITPQTPLPVDVETPDSATSTKAASQNVFDRDLSKRTQDVINERLTEQATKPS